MACGMDVDVYIRDSVQDEALPMGLSERRFAFGTPAARQEFSHMMTETDRLV